MNSDFCIVVGQINFIVGDISTNADRIIQAASCARDMHQADVVIFPELALTGYPPEDLLLRHGFNVRVQAGLEKIMQAIKGIDVILGHPHESENKLYNAASLIRDGHIISTYYKQYLPNYSVFDEKRYFEAGTQPCVVSIGQTIVAIMICEDIWHPEPITQAVQAQADMIVVLNASPFYLGKYQERLTLVKQSAVSSQRPIVYAHCVGGQDELVFDGASLVMDATGQICAQAAFFEEAYMPVHFTYQNKGLQVCAAPIATVPNDEAMVYTALVIGLRDYIQKNKFNGVLVGLSGGIDSALTLAIAVDAIGADHVVAVAMPSRYSSAMSLEDAKAQAEALGVECHTLSIEPVYSALLTTLAPLFSGYIPDVTEENLQARARGTLLMALSNKTGKMVVTTGNKSEMAVGYATLYGDMVGGFAVLKDVVKTMVYRLARYRNRQKQVIPERVIARPPTAELAPEQKDEDSLPPYEILDEIIQRYVEQEQNVHEIVAAGFEYSVVVAVLRLVDKSEYKRRQAAPGVKVTPHAFGRDRRYPITWISPH